MTARVFLIETANFKGYLPVSQEHLTTPLPTALRNVNGTPRQIR
jgi:hypothetical protein